MLPKTLREGRPILSAGSEGREGGGDASAKPKLQPEEPKKEEGTAMTVREDNAQTQATLPYFSGEDPEFCEAYDAWVKTQDTNDEPGEGTPEWEEKLHEMALTYPDSVVDEPEVEQDNHAPEPENGEPLFVDHLPQALAQAQEEQDLLMKGWAEVLLASTAPTEQYNEIRARHGMPMLQEQDEAPCSENSYSTDTMEQSMDSTASTAESPWPNGSMLPAGDEEEALKEYKGTIKEDLHMSYARKKEPVVMSTDKGEIYIYLAKKNKTY